MNEELYFVSDAHRQNYEELLKRFDEHTPEFRSAMYISALPMMYYKYRDYLLDEDNYSPVSWIWDYVVAIEEGSEPPFDLTNAMYQMGLLALNLFNSYDGFNLMEALKPLDEDNERVLISAIKERLKRR